MELADYLKVVRRRWWVVLLAILLGVGGAAAATFAQTPRFTATTQLIVAGAKGESSTDELVARQLAAQRAGAYAVLLQTDPAVAQVSAKAGATGAAPAVVAEANGTDPFINISVTANSGTAAAAIANAYATEIPAIISTLEQRPTDSAVTISVLRPAVASKYPSSPNHNRDLMIGSVVGLLLGLITALLRESLDARLRDSAEIEKYTGVTLLGSVPKEHGGDVLPSVSRPRSGRAEAYRHVRTNLEFTSADGMPRSVVVTSPAPGEGKSSLSANLAVVAARSGRSVVLVDADLRKPSIAKYFGLQSSVGLSDVLSGRWRWQEALVPVEGEQIHVLTSGPIPKFPSELVGSASMSHLIQELEEHFDFVIIDTPPVLPVSDALVIGVNVGGVIVVARMVETRRAALKRAIDAVRKVNATLLGVVGNAVVKQEEKAYGEGYGYAYGYITDAPAEQLPPTNLQPAERRDPATRPRGGRHASRIEPEPEAIPPLLAGAAGDPYAAGHVFPPQSQYPAQQAPLPPQQQFPQQAQPTEWPAGPGYLQQGHPPQAQPYAEQYPQAYPQFGQGYPSAEQQGYAQPGYAPEPPAAAFPPGFAVPQQPTTWGVGSAAAWPDNPPVSPVEPMRLDDIFRQPPPPRV